MILGFSTTGPYCGAALFSGDSVIVDTHEEMARGQGERLMVLIEETLAQAGVTYTDLQAIGVGIGPGNFTGIRLSVSAARGLALGLDIPAVGVSSLEALTFGHKGPVLASIPAGRDRLYLQRFAKGADRGPELVSLGELQGWSHPELICVGNRDAEIAAELGAKTGSSSVHPASAVAQIAALRWQDNPSPPVPLYIRSADAAPSRDLPPRILD
ncbi:MAG: tRNA (adenosine(37)-N6)-threonylcarbamoyltransferase complex dimerization subunit type 1 TsaB [Arenibacterium sp.]